jgi:undecaprenyl-diphosphatase
MLMRSTMVTFMFAFTAAVFAAPHAVMAAAPSSSKAAPAVAASKGAASSSASKAATATTGKGMPTSTAGKAAASTATAGKVAATESSGRAAADVAAGHKISAGQSAILGLIQGLTEYLPVSSTGHLILANYAMGMSEFSDKVGPLGRVMKDNDAVDDFDIILHLGTWLAVLGLYRKRVWQMVRGVVGKDPGGAWLLLTLAVATVPAGVAGLLLKKHVEENLYNPLTVAMALAVGGVLMIVVEMLWRKYRRADRLTDVTRIQLWQAAVIGVAQAAALWPGTSRSMITIVAALIVGLDMLAAAEFSFLLALPTLGAATSVTILKHGKDMMNTVTPEAMAIGLVVTAIVAFFVMKGLIKWLTSHGLSPFGYYRIALAVAVYVYFFVM